MPDSIFLLETIAYRVVLTDVDQQTNTCPLCVSFRFPRLVDLDVCEGTVCRSSSGGGQVVMTRGKSCLLSVNAKNICQAARDFCDSNIEVYRRVNDGFPETRFVAQARLEFDKTFEDLILNPNQSDKKRELITVSARRSTGRVRR